jgi:hypothetical protein
MTTALLLVLPVIGMVTLGVAAKFTIRSKAMELESISAVWPTVLEALPSVEHDHHEHQLPERELHEPVAVSRAA